MTQPPMAAGTRGASRVLSVDLLRGLDVFLMLFVNEIAGVHGTPAFLKHVGADADGMTITDIVFPAFLFLTGMAIPLALGGRLRRGEPRAQIWRHVLLRTLALLVIGVFMVNAEESGGAGVLPPPIWTIVMTIGVILVWHRIERGDRAPRAAADASTQRKSNASRETSRDRGAPDAPATINAWIPWAIGVAILIALALLYREAGASGAFQMRPRWWGILGLIGWAYLVAATVYLRTGDHPFALLGVTALLYCVALADHAGQLAWLSAAGAFISVGSVLGSHGAITVSGAVLTALLIRHRESGRPPSTFLWPAAAYAAGLGAAALLLHGLHALHPAFFYNKIHATVPWSLMSSAWTAAAFVIVFAIVDLAGWRRWPPSIAMAGENALITYLMAPFLLAIFGLLELLTGVNPYAALGRDTVVGFIRSALFAWVVIRLCGWIRARGLRVQI